MSLSNSGSGPKGPDASDELTASGRLRLVDEEDVMAVMESNADTDPVIDTLDKIKVSVSKYKDATKKVQVANIKGQRSGQHIIDVRDKARQTGKIPPITGEHKAVKGG